MYFVDFPLLDPILSIGFSLFILRGVYKTLTATTKLFLQAVPEHLNLEAINTELTKIDGIINVHDCHIWTLDGESHVLTMHAVIPTDLGVNQLEQLKIAIRETVKTFGKFHLTIEFETEEANCKAINCVKL